MLLNGTPSQKIDLLLFDVPMRCLPERSEMPFVVGNNLK